MNLKCRLSPDLNSVQQLVFACFCLLSSGCYATGAALIHWTRPSFRSTQCLQTMSSKKDAVPDLGHSYRCGTLSAPGGGSQYNSSSVISGWTSTNQKTQIYGSWILLTRSAIGCFSPEGSAARPVSQR